MFDKFDCVDDESVIIRRDASRIHDGCYAIHSSIVFEFHYSQFLFF
jgi:ribosome-interacting GTPase 1